MPLPAHSPAQCDVCGWRTHNLLGTCDECLDRIDSIPDWINQPETIDRRTL
jgi:hypothetical protein